MPWRKLALGVLYPLVFLLVAVPPVVVGLLASMCMNPTGGPCRQMTSRALFSGEIAVIWMPPFVLAAVLVWVIFRLHRAGGA